MDFEYVCIQESYHKYFNLKVDKTRMNLVPTQFIPDLDVTMMDREMYWGIRRISLGDGTAGQCGYQLNGERLYKMDGILEKHLPAEGVTVYGSH